MSKATITAIILTYNEEQHIARAIRSAQTVAERVCVIDSLSTDATVKIAQDLGAEVFSNPFENHAAQLNWGIERANITSQWTLRLDADEVLEPPLQQSIQRFIQAPLGANAALLRRKIVFLGREIKHGFFYPILGIRLWKSGQGRAEQRWMDEHITVINPQVITLEGDLRDENLNDLAWWTAKHVGYAEREVFDIIARREAIREPAKLSGKARRKRFLKEQLYARLPSTLRSTLYFLYRYLFCLGFLDGKSGFYFHFLQAYWYRTLVDAKLLELEQKAAELNLRPFEYLQEQGVFEKAIKPPE
ncbi:MAG: glycosyltransferase family 2 protein [Paracoccaceae bacterium]